MRTNNQTDAEWSRQIRAWLYVSSFRPDEEHHTKLFVPSSGWIRARLGVIYPFVRTDSNAFINMGQSYLLMEILILVQWSLAPEWVACFVYWTYQIVSACTSILTWFTMERLSIELQIHLMKMTNDSHSSNSSLITTASPFSQCDINNRISDNTSLLLIIIFFSFFFSLSLVFISISLSLSL